MPVREKSSVAGVLGIIVVSVVLALLGAMLLTQASRKAAVPLKSPIQVRQDDVRNLERLLQEDLEMARTEHKTPDQVEEIKAKYDKELTRLKAEIAKLKAGEPLEVP